MKNFKYFKYSGILSRPTNRGLKNFSFFYGLEIRSDFIGTTRSFFSIGKLSRIERRVRAEAAVITANSDFRVSHCSKLGEGIGFDYGDSPYVRLELARRNPSGAVRELNFLDSETRPPSRGSKRKKRRRGTVPERDRIFTAARLDSSVVLRRLHF